MAINNYKDFVETAYQRGKVWYQAVSSSNSANNQTANNNGPWRWYSHFCNQVYLLLSTNSPRSFSGASNTFVPVSGGTARDIFLGPTPAAGEQKMLSAVTLFQNNVSSAYDTAYLIDVLGYYPLVDGTVVGTTNFTTTLSLPAYTSGDGVRAYFSSTVGLTQSLVSASVSYTNQDGVSGRTSNFYVISSTQTSNDVCNVTTSGQANYGEGNTFASPFLPLQGNDRGMRSIQSITFNASASSYVNVVLCYPLLNSPISTGVFYRDGYRFDMMNHLGLPQPIRTDAAINFLTSQSSSFTYPSRFRGLLEFVWG